MQPACPSEDVCLDQSGFHTLCFSPVNGGSWAQCPEVASPSAGAPGPGRRSVGPPGAPAPTTLGSGVDWEHSISSLIFSRPGPTCSSLAPQPLSLQSSFRSCRWGPRLLRDFSLFAPFFPIPSSPDKGIMSQSPLSRQLCQFITLGGGDPAAPLHSCLRVRLTGDRRESLKPRDSHQLCPAQFWGVTSILSVLEHYEDWGASFSEYVKNTGTDLQLSNPHGARSLRSHRQSPLPLF